MGEGKKKEVLVMGEKNSLKVVSPRKKKKRIGQERGKVSASKKGGKKTWGAREKFLKKKIPKTKEKRGALLGKKKRPKSLLRGGGEFVVGGKKEKGIFPSR